MGSKPALTLAAALLAAGTLVGCLEAATISGTSQASEAPESTEEEWVVTSEFGGRITGAGLGYSPAVYTGPSDFGFEAPPNATALTATLRVRAADLSGPGAGFVTFWLTGPGGAWVTREDAIRHEDLVVSATPREETVLTVEDPPVGVWVAWIGPHHVAVDADFLLTVEVRGTGAAPA